MKERKVKLSLSHVAERGQWLLPLELRNLKIAIIYTVVNIRRAISDSVFTRIEPKMQQNDLENKIWDCIVVGAGIEGSNTARYSASLGKKTLCLEQVGHSSLGCQFSSFVAKFTQQNHYLFDLSESKTKRIPSQF